MKKILTKNGKVITSDRKMLVYDLDGATIKSGGWQGTAVPNTGYVENIYFNTNLSIEEVVSILKQINLENEYIVFLEQNEERTLFVGYNMAGLNEYVILDHNNNVCFSNVDGGWGFIGWNTNITNPIVVNSEVLSEIGSTTIGTQNDKLSNIFSTTPFTNETIELSGEYDGSTIEVTDLSGGWQGTTVPNSGYVENVYLNTNLSVEEVVSLLEKLNYNADLMSSSGIDTYGLIANKGVNIIMVGTFNGNYAIMDALSNVYFSSAIVEGLTTFVGWNENFNGVISFNAEAIPSMSTDAQFIGQENDKVSNLFSTTPFTKSEENTINIKKYINEKKIPLSIKVNVDTGAGGGNLSLENAIVVKTTDMTDATELLSYNETLTEVTIGNTNIYTTDYMFRSCHKLKKVEILNFNFNSAGGMFYDCCSLKAVIIRELNNIENCSAYDMFTGCYHISGFKDDSYNPEGFRDGYVYIPRESINAFNDFLDRYDASYVKNQVRILEDYTVDGTTTGAMDEEKMNKKEGFEVRLLVDSGDWDSVSDLFDYSTVDDYYAWSDIPEYASEDFNSEGYLVLLRGVKQIKFRLVDGAYFNCNELNTTILCTDPMYEDTQLFTLTSDIHITLRHTTEEDFEEEPTEGYELRFSFDTWIEYDQVSYSIDNKKTWYDVERINGNWSSEYEFSRGEGYFIVETGVSQIAFRLQGCYIEGYGGSLNINATTDTYEGTYETQNYILDDHLLITAQEIEEDILEEEEEE